MLFRSKQEKRNGPGEERIGAGLGAQPKTNCLAREIHAPSLARASHAPDAFWWSLTTVSVFGFIPFFWAFPGSFRLRYLT